MEHDNSGKRKERGAALVLVIWAIGVLAFTASQISVASRLSYSETKTGRNLLVIDTLLEGAIRRATSEWDHGISSKTGGVTTCSLEQGWLSIKVVPANARISLNSSSERTLYELLRRLGATEKEASQYSAAIIDYRDADDTPQPGGAEKASYRSAGLNHFPKNAPLESSLELHYIPGLSTDMIERLRDETTPRNYNPSINSQYASAIAKEVVNGGVPPTTLSRNSRKSNRDIRPQIASRTLGADPIIIVATVSFASLRRSLEVTLGRRSNASNNRMLLEYRPLYHYHLPRQSTERMTSCFGISALEH